MKTIHYAVAPIHNLTLPSRWNLAVIGQYRIVKVRPWQYHAKRVPKQIAEEMRRSPILRDWVSVLEEGYYSEREMTPRYVLFFFPPPGIADHWMNDPRRDFEEAEQYFEAFLAALRIHSSNYVSIPGTRAIGVKASEFDAIYEGRQEAVRTPAVPTLYNPRYNPPDEPAYSLESSDLTVVEDLVNGTVAAFKTRLAIALRRFLQSGEKETADRFIDLLVTLEVLYGDSDPTAAGHKIAFRAATVAGETIPQRTRIFSLLKKAYASRSAILHGRSAGTDAPNLNEVEEITRRSLKWFVAKASETGEAPDGKDVDKLCFDSTPLQL